MKKYILKILYLALIISIALTLSYRNYTEEKLSIIYVENNFLYKWYNDFYIAYNKNVPYNKFIEKISKSDIFIYKLLKENKIQLVDNTKKGKDFIWFRSKKGKIIENSEYTFFKYLFSRDNVCIKFHFKEYFTHKQNHVYKFDNNSFELVKYFNENQIRKKYIETLKCKSHFIFSNDNYKQEAEILIQSGKISFLNSNFSIKSEKLLKETLTKLYSETKDTLFIYFRYYNIEDAICLE